MNISRRDAETHRSCGKPSILPRNIRQKLGIGAPRAPGKSMRRLKSRTRNADPSASLRLCANKCPFVAPSCLRVKPIFPFASLKATRRIAAYLLPNRVAPRPLTFDKRASEGPSLSTIGTGCCLQATVMLARHSLKNGGFPTLCHARERPIQLTDIKLPCLTKS